MFTHLDDPAPPTAAPEMADRAVAEGRRRLRRRQATLGGVTAALLLVVGVVGGLTMARGDDRDGVVVASRGDGEGRLEGSDLGSTDSLRMLSMFGARGSRPGVVRAAVDAAEYQALWDAVSGDTQPPPVDFPREVVVSITLRDGGCGSRLARFDNTGGVLTPVFEVDPLPRTCQLMEPGGSTYVVALDRRSVRPPYALPWSEKYEYAERRPEVRVP